MPVSGEGALRVGGRYEIVSLVGVGGMGTVYRARDLELDDVVALKVVRRELLGAAGVLERFRREVKLARRVTHPNVARVFDIGEHEGDRFLTMEYVDGTSLGALLSRAGPLPVTRVVEIGRAIAAGLSAAHAASVLHRDLKPDNVLVAHDGRILLTDFGIARALAQDPMAQHTVGVTLGTPAYMAPEQVEGKELDGRADVYALGLVLYEMLTGEPAWAGDTIYALAMARLMAPPPDPRARRPNVPPALADLVLRASARKREDRFESAHAMEQALAAVSATYTPKDTPVRFELPRPNTRPQEGKTIAVIPFRNYGSEGDAYLVDGLVEDLVDTLSNARGLSVKPLRERGSGDPREIGRELGVQVVVEGSVRRAGDQLRVHVRLIHVADGFQLWAQRFDRRIEEVLAIGDEASAAIARALTIDCVADPKRPPSDPIALDLYLRARHAYHGFWRENVDRALALYEEALARAPDDPLIVSGYAMALMRRWSSDAGDDALAERGRAAAEKAIVLAPQFGEPRVALGSFRLQAGDAVGAARELQEGLRLAPGSAEANDQMGRLLIECGAIDEGIGRLRAARELEPRFERTLYDEARAHLLVGRVLEAEALFAIVPTMEPALGIYWFTRARACMWRNDSDAARRVLVDIETATFTMRAAVQSLCITLAERRAVPGSAEMLAGLTSPGSRNQRRRAFGYQIAAEAAAASGDDEQALAALERSCDAGLFDRPWLAAARVFDSLRDAPRFRRVSETVEARARAVRDALAVCVL